MLVDHSLYCRSLHDRVKSCDLIGDLNYFCTKWLARSIGERDCIQPLEEFAEGFRSVYGQMLRGSINVYHSLAWSIFVDLEMLGVTVSVYQVLQQRLLVEHG